MGEAMDLFDKCAAWTDVQVVKLAGRYPYYRVIEESAGTEVVSAGRRLIMASSNDYLGLSHDPRVREAAAEAARRWGSSTCGSRLLNGTLAMHDELDHRLARFFGKEAAVCFSTGFQTNLGTISSLVQRRDVAFADRMAHASIVEGLQASPGETRRFRHNDVQDLERLLSAAPAEAGKLVVVDGVYSMEGDLADLPRLVEAKERHGARLMVDEAHGLGVMGPGGRGAGEHFGLMDRVDLVMATFSKSLASIGGVIAGRADVVNWIRHKARALLFSASMTPAAAAAALRALDIIEQEPERRERLWAISERLHRELRSMGFDTRPSVTPVIPIVVGDQFTVFDFWRLLTEAGLFVSPVVKPAVEKELVRAVFMATHTDEQVDRALEAFQRCGRKLGLIPSSRPHSRVEVQLARPGSTGFVSSDPAAGGAGGMAAAFDVAAMLRNAAEPLSRRLSDAAEYVTWRALQAGPEDVRRMARLPSQLWAERRRLRNRLLSAGAEWVSRRQASGLQRAGGAPEEGSEP
jgi:8-amino-7-oxononanoate synthase